METPLSLESFVERFVRFMGFNPEVRVREAGRLWQIDVEVRDGSGLLIGHNGEGINALEYMLRRLLRKQYGDQEMPRIALDVNGYRREKAVALREEAREVADQVRRSGELHRFPPLPARERRVIHLELASRGDVVTESFGEGKSRHVVVKPAEELI